MTPAPLYQGQSIGSGKLETALPSSCFDRKEDAINKFDLRTLTELGEATEAIKKDGSVKASW